MKKNGTRRAGVSLIEALIAIVILAAFITGMCKVIVITREATDRARAHYTAVNLAKNRLERALALPFDALEQFSEDAVVVNANGVGDSSGRYRRSTSVVVVTNLLKEVIVDVAIRDRVTLEFGTESELLKSYIADITKPVPAP